MRISRCICIATVTSGRGRRFRRTLLILNGVCPGDRRRWGANAASLRSPQELVKLAEAAVNIRHVPGSDRPVLSRISLHLRFIGPRCLLVTPWSCGMIKLLSRSRHLAPARTLPRRGSCRSPGSRGIRFHGGFYWTHASHSIGHTQHLPRPFSSLMPRAVPFTSLELPRILPGVCLGRAREWLRLVTTLQPLSSRVGSGRRHRILQVLSVP